MILAADDYVEVEIELDNNTLELLKLHAESKSVELNDFINDILEEYVSENQITVKQ